MTPTPPGSNPVDPLARFRLDGRVALVTGASSGLGEAVARALAGVGASVALVARRRERLQALADDIGGAAFACDLLDNDEVDALVPQVASELGGPEILFNAAGGIDGAHRAHEEPLGSIQRTLQLDLVAPYRLSQAVYPHMVAAGRGSILHVSSISGLVGIKSIPQASYAAAKLGLSGLTRDLAVQWAKHSIRVNTLAPGFFHSEITDPLYTDPQRVEWLRSNTLLPMQGSADDFVGAALWLLSDASRYVTGQTIVVDGGWTTK